MKPDIVLTLSFLTCPASCLFSAPVVSFCPLVLKAAFSPPAVRCHGDPERKPAAVGISSVRQCPVTSPHTPEHAAEGRNMASANPLGFKPIPCFRASHSSPSHLDLLFHLPFLFSVHGDVEVLGWMHCRVAGADLVRVKRSLHHVPLVCCEQHPDVRLFNHLWGQKVHCLHSNQCQCFLNSLSFVSLWQLKTIRKDFGFHI